MNHKCITITLNPSLNRTLTVQNLCVGYDNQVVDTNLDPAGRGMNISAALQNLKVRNEAIVLLGDDPSSHAYEAMIRDRAFPVHVVRYNGAIRSNVFIFDSGKNTHTVLKEQGDNVSQEALSCVAELLIKQIEPDDYAIFAGALPVGVDDEVYGRLAKVAKRAGARVVLDTAGKPLEHGVRAKPDLVVLNQTQLESFFNFPVRSHEGVVWCAHKLREDGAVRVLIMLDDDSGAFLATDSETLLAEFPDDIDPGTYAGTYDAMIAGYLAGRIKQRPLEQALTLGGAGAIYTSSQVGAEFGTPAEIKEYLTDVDVTRLKEDEKP
jgi:1-phosphofructokinase